MRLGTGSYYNPKDETSPARQMARFYYFRVLAEHYPEMVETLRDVFREDWVTRWKIGGVIVDFPSTDSSVTIPYTDEEIAANRLPKTSIILRDNDPKTSIAEKAANEPSTQTTDEPKKVGATPPDGKGEMALLPWREKLDWLPKPPKPEVDDEEPSEGINPKYRSRVNYSKEFDEWIFDAARIVLNSWERQGVETALEDLDPVLTRGNTFPQELDKGPRKELALTFNLYTHGILTAGEYPGPPEGPERHLAPNSTWTNYHTRETFHYVLPENASYAYDPYLETKAEARARICKAFGRSLEPYFAEVEEAYEKAGWVKVPFKRVSKRTKKSDDLEHFRWLFHVHVLGWTQKKLGDEVGVTEVAVSDVLNPLRALIFYPTN